MKPYKNVYYEHEGKLIRNSENRITYTDSQGNKRIKTNPTYSDFAKIGMLRKVYMNEMPEYDPLTQTVTEEHTVNGDYFEVTYVVKKVL